MANVILRIAGESRNRRGPETVGYSIHRASKETGIPEGRIRRAIKNDEVKIVKLGGIMRIPRSEVERLKALYD